MSLKISYFKKKSTTIFLFHGVSKNKKNNVINYTNKHINYKKFIRYLKFFKNNGQNISIDELVYCIKNNINPPDNSFAITFDDGFKNNITVAAEILENYNFKATFYLSTNFIENNQNSWIDEIEFFTENHSNFKIKLDTKHLYFSNSFKSKISFLENVRNIVKKNININSEKLKKLFKDKNLKLKKKYPLIFEKMNWDDVQKLNRNSLFTVGGHSHLHQIFTSMNTKDMKTDITKSINLFKKRINLDITHYSYPEGMKNSFSKREIVFLKKNNIICCPSAISGINNKNSDLFYLKRNNCF